MTKPKRILILLADLGFGHRSAANAISAALTDRYGKKVHIEIVNPLEHERTLPILRDAQAEYDRIVREAANLYKMQYEVMGTAVGAALTESAVTLMLVDAIRVILKDYQPDLIMGVQEYLLAPLNLLFRFGQPRVPVITVVTDLSSLHRLWFNEVSDLCVVPTEAARSLGVSVGYPPDKLRLIGIPVNPALAKEQRSQAELRAILGWQPEITTLLVVGSKRMRGLPDVLRVINHSGLRVQVCVVAGGDDDLFAALQQTEWHQSVQLYNYTQDLALMLKAADCLISKAGGLIVSEGLACGLPILLTDVIEGQETGNAEYVVQGGAGERAQDAIGALEVLFHWLAEDGKKMKEVAAAAKQLGRADAADEIAQLVWQRLHAG